MKKILVAYCMVLSFSISFATSLSSKVDSGINHTYKEKQSPMVVMPVKFYLSCTTITYTGIFGDVFDSMALTSLGYWWDLLDELYCGDDTVPAPM